MDGSVMGSGLGRRRIALLAVGAVLLVAAPAVASEPASNTVTAGDPANEVTWTGQAPPSVGEGVTCADLPVSDTHELTLEVPDGATAQLTVVQTYEHDGTNDPMLAVTTPDGEVVTADSTIGATEESLTIPDAKPGTYTVHHCHYAGGPTDYTGTARALITGVAGETTAAPRPATCAAPADLPQFEMAYIDQSRAGGEPILDVHPDGQLLWGSHAGTTHFYTPASPSAATSAFVENYEGQTYYYVSDDGETFDFVPRSPVDPEDVTAVAGVPASGFSDPEFAVDQAGNVYISEINLANVAVSKSTDGGHSYTLQNVFAFTGADRQWMAADREDELYMTANGFGGGPFPGDPASGNTAGGNLEHFMAKSTDGGVTWNGASYTNPDGVGDLHMDGDAGVLYEMSVTSDGTIGVARFPNVRDELTDFTVDVVEVASGVGLTGVQRLIDPTLALDDAGNLYVVWSDNGAGEAGRAPGIYFSASADGGDTWTPIQRVDPDDRDEVWPWIAVGAPGQVAIGWLQSDLSTGATLPGEAGGEEAQWTVSIATTSNGLGCDGNGRAGFAVTTATSEPIHTGTICQHGTTCQTDLTDRRLGDYFSLAVDHDGRIHVAVSDTRQGGATALPLHVRQVGGATLDEPPAPQPAPAPEPQPTDEPAPLPVTGGGMALVGLALIGIAVSGRLSAAGR